jgi:O-antigen ligase
MPPPVDAESISDTASVERAQLWRVASAMFLAHPITGVGPDGFRNLYGEYAGVTQWNKNIYTNNTYLEFFTNLGLLGGLAFLWLAALALWNTGRALLTSQRGPIWLLGLGVTASLAAFFTHGVVDYFLFSTPLYLVFWFLLSVSGRWATLRTESMQ